MASVRNDLSMERTHPMNGRACTKKTIAGPFTVIADESGTVLRGGFTDDVDELADGGPILETLKQARAIPGVTEHIDAYFDGELDALDRIEIAPQGSPRKIAAWEAMRRIPPGSMSYREYATYIPPPASARSAARACATNPIALIVPCHRMVRSDGSLGGYGWGLTIKERLLEHEERFM